MLLDFGGVIEEDDSNTGWDGGGFVPTMEVRSATSMRSASTSSTWSEWSRCRKSVNKRLTRRAARRASFLSFPTLPMLLRVDWRPQIPFGLVILNPEICYLFFLSFFDWWWVCSIFFFLFFLGYLWSRILLWNLGFFVCGFYWLMRFSLIYEVLGVWVDGLLLDFVWLMHFFLEPIRWS